MTRTMTSASRCSHWMANNVTPITIRITPGSQPLMSRTSKASPVRVKPQGGGTPLPCTGDAGRGRRAYVSGRRAMVTWEMPDGTEFRYLGIGVSDAALREFVLRFMSSEGMSWDASAWDVRQIELAFLRRFGETIKVLRERTSGGRTVLILKPVMSGA